MLIAILFAASVRQAQVVHVEVDGVDREALVVQPQTPSAHPPLLFGYHGHGGNMNFASRSFKLEESWPQALVVYPQGLPTKSYVDPQGNSNGWSSSPDDQNRDVRFFDALYAKVMADYKPNPKQVFAMGHSNGAQFMYVLWKTRGDKFAAFGSCEGAGAQTMALSPKPFFITIGDQDLIVPPRLQKRSLAAVFKTDDSSDSGTPYGDKGLLYKGTQPVVLWEYQGGHKFPADCVPSMIRFFQSLCR